MEEIYELEAKALTEAIEKEALVRIFLANGYQVQAEIIDFDRNVIVCKVNGKTWMIYRQVISTIVLD